VRRRVLDNARLRKEDRVLDVGAGTGLLAFGALERIGPDGEVIALDPSADCLEELQRLAREQGLNGRLSYLVGDAEVLPLPDASVEAVLTRSVLVYVRDKAEAARELFRVLRPGGRVSIFEPVNRRNTRLYEAVDFGELHERVAVWEERCYASPDDPMVNFDADDLVRLFEEAGFALELELDEREERCSVERMLHGIGAPGRPSQVEKWREEFSPGEVERLVAAVESAGPVPRRWIRVYLWGEKPL